MSAEAVITIRDAVASDVEGMVAMARECAEVGHWTGAQYLDAIEGVEEFVRRRVWVAEASGRVAGVFGGDASGRRGRDRVGEHPGRADTAAERRGGRAVQCVCCVDARAEGDGDDAGSARVECRSNRFL